MRGEKMIIRYGEDTRWFFRNIDKCKQIIGEERIYSILKKIDLSRQSNLLRLQRREPLLYNIHMADMQLYESSSHLVISDQIIKISTLGHYLHVLKKNNVNGLIPKINELFTAKFEKTLYEIQIAASISKKGFIVEFVQENPDKKTPDIIVHLDGCDIEIECKKKDDMTSRDRQNSTFWRRITNEANKIMNQNKKNLVLILEMQSDPKNSDFESIIREIKTGIEKIGEELVVVEKKSYKFSLKQTDPFDKVVECSQINLDNSQKIWSFAIQSGDYYKTCGISDSIIELDEESFHCEGKNLENGLMQQKNRRFFGFRSKTMPDRITSIIDSSNKASKQLSGNNPGVIFIDQNIVNRENAETDLKRIYPLIKGVLRNNPRISGIAITQIFHINDPQQYKYRHNVQIFPNEQAKFPLPQEIFEICNIKR